jgi:hypothetical protein
MAKRNAKGRFVKGRAKREEVAAPKKRATKAKRVRSRRRPNPDAAPSTVIALAGNPPMMTDLLEFIIPGFGGFAATKFLARIVEVQLSKRYPKVGKHAAVASTVASFLAAWFLLHRIERLKKYHTPAVVGSAIAALQTIVKTYLPKYGWMVSDVQPSEVKILPTASSPLLAQTMASTGGETLFPGGPEIVDDQESEEDLLAGLGLGSLGSGDEEFAEMN